MSADNQASICYAIFVNPASFADLPADAPRCLEDPTASGKARSWLYAGFMPHRKFEALNGEYGVSVIPCFQGHKVGAQAVALTLDWFFRLPKDGGLGLRKVSASLYHSNEISKKFHDFLGFRREGLMRAQRLGKPGDSWNDFRELLVKTRDWTDSGQRVERVTRNGHAHRIAQYGTASHTSIGKKGALRSGWRRLKGASRCRGRLR